MREGRDGREEEREGVREGGSVSHSSVSLLKESPRTHLSIEVDQLLNSYGVMNDIQQLWSSDSID